MRKKIIAGNWKMNKTPSEAKALVAAMKDKVKDAACDVVVCPTAICIPKLYYSQDIHSILGWRSLWNVKSSY